MDTKLDAGTEVTMTGGASKYRRGDGGDLLARGVIQLLRAR